MSICFLIPELYSISLCLLRKYIFLCTVRKAGSRHNRIILLSHSHHLPSHTDGVWVSVSAFLLLFPCFFRVLQEAAPKGTPLRHSCIKWHPRSYDQQGKGRGVFWPDAVFPKHGPGGGGGTGAPPRSHVLGESQLTPLALSYSPHEYHTPMPLRGRSC